MKKKVLATLLVGTMAASLLAGCGTTVETTGSSDTTTAPEKTQTTETAEAGEAGGSDVSADITLWTYPIGEWGNAETVDSLIQDFNKEYPGINVTVEYLDYTNGDDQVNTAIEGGQAPDLIMEGPERLVANWGAKGLMVDLSDILDDTDKSEIYESVLSACVNKEGATYEYPLCMTAHCMAINKTVFEEADAMQYVDAENHTWTTDDFFKAMDAVYAHTGQTVGAVYCSGQGGDQGTRALINNLYGGTFTDADHTKYTADSAENVKAIQALVDSKAIGFDASIAGGDEINLFRQGVLNVAFCWNIAQQLNADNNDAGLTNDGDEILFMAFPSEKATDTKLCGGIWGFGVFDNGDANKIEASKLFIKYMADSAEGTPDAVLSSTYFPVRDTVEGKDLTGLYGDVQTMSDYSTLMQYLGDYYQVTPGWAEAGLCHDLGKVNTPKTILYKPGSLTDEEFEVIKRHPIDGYNFCKQAGVDEEICNMVLKHHVKKNSKGYPEGYPTKTLPEEIITVADIFCALSEKRTYHSALEYRQALDFVDSFEDLDKQVLKALREAFDD